MSLDAAKRRKKVLLSFLQGSSIPSQTTDCRNCEETATAFAKVGTISSYCAGLFTPAVTARRPCMGRPLLDVL